VGLLAWEKPGASTGVACRGMGWARTGSGVWVGRTGAWLGRNRGLVDRPGHGTYLGRRARAPTDMPGGGLMDSCEAGGRRETIVHWFWGGVERRLPRLIVLLVGGRHPGGGFPLVGTDRWVAAAVPPFGKISSGTWRGQRSSTPASVPVRVAQVESGPARHAALT